MSHLRTIGLGAITGTVSSVVSLGAGIITVPLLVRALGTDAYGLLGVVSSVVGFVGMADLGLASTLMNAMSYAKAREDYSAVKGLYSGGLLVYTPLMLALFGVAALVVYAPWFSLAKLLSIPPALEGAAELTVLVMLGYTMLNAFLGGVVKAVYHGMNDVAVYNTIQTAYNVVFALVFIAYLLWGDVTLFGVAFVQGAGAVVRLVIQHVIAKRRYPWLSFVMSTKSVHAVRPLLQYSAVLFLSTASTIILERSDNIVIAHFAGLAAVAVYSLAYKLFALPSAMLPIVTASAPTVAMLYEKKDWGALGRFYRQILRANMVVKFTVFSFLAVFAREIITAWVGRDLFAGYAVVLAIWGAFMLFVWNGSHALFFWAMQDFIPGLKANVAAIIINLALSILLVQKIGIAGVAIGTFVSFLVVNAWYLPWRLGRIVPIHPFREAGVLALRLTPLLIALVALRELLMAFAPDGAWQYAGALVIGLVFAAMVYQVGLDAPERAVVNGIIMRRLRRFKTV
ncbi:MAG: oligosaccharide flippase family protein [Patescibacteria group bacterium]|mgnify:FL=1